jgi:transglutaminase-like putative cysteine protease
MDTTGGTLSFQFGPLMEIRSEPEEQAKKLEEAADIFTKGIAWLEGSIGKGRDVGRVEELVLEAKGKGVASLRNAPRQTVEPGADGTATLRLGAGHGEPDSATEEEIREALKETVEFPVNDARVRAAAAEAIGPAKTALEKTERLVRWVSRRLADEVCVDWVSAERLLDRKGGDCSEHALLFTTLARAAGLPARTVSGLMYMGDEVHGFGGHAWNEVVIDGHWVPVDATHDQVTLDATHVVLAREGRDHEFLQASGGLSFRVVSAVVTPPRGGGEDDDEDEPVNPVVPPRADPETR